MWQQLNESEVVKHIIAVNVLLYIITAFVPIPTDGPYPGLYDYLALWYIGNEHFNPAQLVTHMFMHGGLWHLAFNMYALFIFGVILERVWGAKRFLIFYMICGLGAACLHLGAWVLETYMDHHTIWVDIPYPMLGASGAVYGVFFAFAFLFPNTELRLLFPPITLQAKYLVAVAIVIELGLQFASFEGDNIAHLAHLGGMLFAYILIKIWSRDRTRFY